MASGVTVAYNGNVIHQMPSNGTFKMNTANVYMEGDIDVVVDVDSGSSATLISKTITQNGVYNASADNADGYNEVTVNVSGGITPSGDINIVSNGTYDVTNYASAIVNVPQGGGGDGTIGLSVVLGGESGSFFNSTLTSLRAYAIYSCSTLTEVEMTGCETIGSSAFAFCSNLSQASFPMCESVGANAFGSCSNLSQVNMPNLKSIANYAFLSCSALQKISFPQLVSIGMNSAFYNCRSLSQAFFLGSFFSLGNGTFGNTPMSNSTYLGYFGSIYVPASLYSSYISASRWSAFSARIVSLTDEEIAQL